MKEQTNLTQTENDNYLKRFGLSKEEMEAAGKSFEKVLKKPLKTNRLMTLLSRSK